MRRNKLEVHKKDNWYLAKWRLQNFLKEKVLQIDGGNVDFRLKELGERR